MRAKKAPAQPPTISTLQRDVGKILARLDGPLDFDALQGIAAALSDAHRSALAVAVEVGRVQGCDGPTGCACAKYRTVPAGK